MRIAGGLSWSHRHFRWKIDDKGRSAANSITEDRQRPVHLCGRDSGSMQSKSMTLALGCETMGKNGGDFIGRNTDAVIGDFDSQAISLVYSNTQSDRPVFRIVFQDGLDSIFDEATAR